MSRIASSTILGSILVLAASGPLVGQSRAGTDTAGYSAEECPWCEAWNEPREPIRIFGGTYWVGPRGLGSILVTSSEGHVLIDGALPESAPGIAASIRALGFRVEDVRYILSSHAHFDHAGGIAALQRMSGATVLATASSRRVLERGRPGPDDPQRESALAFPAVPDVSTVADGDEVRVGDVTLTAHVTAGHTPGGTTWSWRACKEQLCRSVVYADSQTPISDDDFLFSSADRYPSALADFERGFALLERLDCDILVTPHPGASNLWERLETNGRPGLVDPEACRRYAATGREQLARRLARERESGDDVQIESRGSTQVGSGEGAHVESRGGTRPESYRSQRLAPLGGRPTR